MYPCSFHVFLEWQEFFPGMWPWGLHRFFPLKNPGKDLYGFETMMNIEVSTVL